ncbi:MAG: HAD-IB family hydrolase [Candidatus Riflebacteria bacterium]|nr:HAD-IB family hydrolase [Candidatus Riflebacteria bacterium]
MKLALFDFDGTITRKDSFAEFLRFSFGDIQTAKKVIYYAHHFLAFYLKLIDNSMLKEKTVKEFFKNMPESIAEQLAKDFAQAPLNSLVKPEMLNILCDYKANGYRVILVSASPELYLKHWTKEHEIELLATKLETKNGYLTGNFASPNCFGPEKVRRLSEILNFSDFSEIHVYGDSRGDREMLAMATRPCLLPSKTSIAENIFIKA